MPVETPKQVTSELTIEEAREVIARLADAAGEVKFAREVRAGCWDHRGDVRAAMAGGLFVTPGHTELGA
jgi:hypothetical protein